MKLLYITESVPNRDPMLGDGSSMIPFEVLRNLPREVAVTLLTFAGPVDVPPEIRKRCAAVQVLATRRRAWAAVLSVFGLNGLGKHERATPKAVAAAAGLSAHHDVTLIHGPHALFLANSVTGPLVLQTVDPWSVRAAMDTAAARTMRPAYRAREFLALSAERRLPQRARLLTVSARDALAWSRRLGRPVRSIPNSSIPNGAVHNGSDHNGSEQSLRSNATRDNPVACFVGSLNYGPNVDSANILIRTIAPLVWQQVPEARFVIAGRRPAPSVLALAGPRVEVLANVPSVLDVLHSADVAVFPDGHGVGIRNSVGEALATGLPVVATPVAAREQAPHALLTVEEDTERFVGHIVNRLLKPLSPDDRPPHGEQENATLRTWKAVTDDYLDELRHAIHAGGAGLPFGTPRA